MWEPAASRGSGFVPSVEPRVADGKRRVGRRKFPRCMNNRRDDKFMAWKCLAARCSLVHDPAKLLCMETLCLRTKAIVG